MKWSQFIQLIKQYWKKSTFGIHRKMFLIHFLIGVTLIVSLSMLVSYTVSNYIRGETKNYVHSFSQQANNNIDTYLDEMDRTIRAIAFNDNIRYFFGDAGFSDFERNYGIIQFMETVTGIASLNKYSSFYVILKNSRYVYSTSTGENTVDFAMYGMEHSAWYRKFMASDTELVLLNDFRPIKGSGGSKFAYGLKFGEGTAREELLFILASDKAFFADSFRHTEQGAPDLTLITDSEGNVVFDSKPEVSAHLGVGSGDIAEMASRTERFATVPFKGINYLVAKNTSPKTGWNVISFIEESKLNRNMLVINSRIYTVTLLFAVVLLLALLFFSYKISGPIKQLATLIKSAEGSNHIINREFKNNDEIRELWASFNMMMHKLVSNEVLRKEAELEALQQQINPHFLYNTLETISALAVKHRCPEIELISEKMGEMFRYSINRGKHEYVALSEEIRHIRNYLTIQNIRFRDRFRFACELEGGVAGLLTLKFILQPIVENAVRHGLGTKRQDGELVLSGNMAGNAVVIGIRDNGAGMTAEQVAQLNALLHEQSAEALPERRQDGRTPGIGLRNVHNRIRLAFGDDYGLSVESVHGAGTNVTVRIPVMKEEEQHAQDDHRGR